MTTDEQTKKPAIEIQTVPGEAEKKLTFSTTFTLDYDAEDGQRLHGRFTAQRLNLGAVGRLAVVKARLNGGASIDAQIDFLHEMLAYLTVALTEVPDWWIPAELYDAAVVRHVYDHVRTWEDSFRRPRVG